MNMKIQNMKQAAYFDYFKSFSLNAFDTIKKLQTQFKQEVEENFFFQSSMMFKRIKTLLGSYQILIFEINDSCQFVEIPQFGNCILKIFLQIMSIIKFLLHKTLQKQQKKDQSLNGNQKHSKTKASFNLTQTNLSSASTSLNHTNEQQRIIYKKKQQSKYIMDNLKQQLSLFQLEQSENMQTSKKQFKSLIQGKQKLQSIEISQNQNILSQALNSFCKKGQHLKNFVNIRQAAMVNNMKQGMGEYLKLKDILDQDSNTKLTSASIKLQELFKSHTTSYIKQKQSQMISQQIQVNFQQKMQTKILQQNKHIKKLNDLIKKLNDEICFQRQKCKSLENLLKVKTEEFELKTMEYRVAKLQMQSFKAKKQLTYEPSSSSEVMNNNSSLNRQSPLSGTKTSLCSNCQHKISPSKIKTQDQCMSRSIIQQAQYVENQQLNSEQTDRRVQQFMQNPSRLMQKMTRRVHYQNKKQIAFKQLDTKFDQFVIQSNVYALTIIPDLIQTLKKDNNLTTTTKKKTLIGRSTSGNVPYMSNTFSYRDHKRNKTKILTTQQRDTTTMIIQKVYNMNIGPFTFNMTIDNELPSKLFGVNKYQRKLTENQQKQPLVRHITQKWLDNKQHTEQQQEDYEEHLQSLNQKYSKFQRNMPEINGNHQGKDSREKAKTYKDKVDLQEGQQKQLIYQNSLFIQNQAAQLLIRKNHSFKITAKGKHLGSLEDNSQQNHHQDQIIQSENKQNKIQQKLKYPRFMKILPGKLTLTMKQLSLIFFDLNTAKNFQYINLFQNDDMRIGSVKGQKRNPILSVNIQQMQKKNFLNNILNKVKNQVKKQQQNSMGYTQSDLMGNLLPFNQNNNSIEITAGSPIYQKHKQGKKINTRMTGPKINKNVITQCQSMSSTFSGTMMKTQFWNNLAQHNNTQLANGQEEYNQMLMLLQFYDFQRLVAILFKQLTDMKRSSILKSSSSINNYNSVKNFLRYPYSTIALANDKTFLDKQKHDTTQIQFLQLRKIMKRVFNLHKSCECRGVEKVGRCTNNMFEKIQGFQSCQLRTQNKKICNHIILFYQHLGISLLPLS